MFFSFLKGARYHQFIKSYPAYKKTKILDKIRRSEYGRIDKEGHVYLDYTGGSLYAKSQVVSHLRLLKDQTFGNPHSSNPTSRSATRLVEETRAHVLKYFNAGEDYFCIFTPNASGALKIVGETYPFTADSALLLSLDNHNSVNGIREFAKSKGASFNYTPLESESLFIDEGELLRNLNAHNEKSHKLFAYPAQSNVSGVKHPLEYVKMAKERGWDVLLDTAAFVPCNKLDLHEVKPDFATVSFYKIFGYPTGLGCLLVRKEMFAKMVKPWYAGGTISLSAAGYHRHFLQANHERFEEGTVNYLTIPAIRVGLKHIEKIGIEVINSRVQALASWLYHQLRDLKHDNGQPLLRIFGTDDFCRRGGTLVMNFYDEYGEIYPFGDIEAAAIILKISIRTGCFCNLGLDEVNNEVSYQELEPYFGSREDGNYHEMIGYTGKLRGSVRVSLGIASNFNDVAVFYEFAKSFLNM